MLSLAVDYFSKAIVDSKVNPYSDTVSCSTAITHPYAQVTSPYLAQGDRGARASNARAAKMAHEPPAGPRLASNSPVCSSAKGSVTPLLAHNPYPALCIPPLDPLSFRLDLYHPQPLFYPPSPALPPPRHRSAIACKCSTSTRTSSSTLASGRSTSTSSTRPTM